MYYKYYNILYYNLMGPPSYMRSVVDRNVVMRRMTIVYLSFVYIFIYDPFFCCEKQAVHFLFVFIVGCDLCWVICVEWSVLNDLCWVICFTICVFRDFSRGFCKRSTRYEMAFSVREVDMNYWWVIILYQLVLCRCTISVLYLFGIWNLRNLFSCVCYILVCCTAF
jgi:hypothetical protein